MTGAASEPSDEHLMQAFAGGDARAFETLYDLLSSRYLALGLKNEERQAWEFDFKPAEASFTPTALRQAGVR